MVKHILQSIEGVEIYPIISLVLFVLSFTFVVLATWRMSRSEVEYASRLPLDNAEPHEKVESEGTGN